MKWERKYAWYLIEMIVFVGLNAFVIIFLLPGESLLILNDPFTLFVLGLAVYRAAHIISSEEITKALRAPFVDLVEKDGKDVEVPKARGLQGSLGSLLYCSSCVGVWMAALLVYGYLLFPRLAFIPAAILALSTIERLLAHLVGFLKKD